MNTPAKSPTLISFAIPFVVLLTGCSVYNGNFTYTPRPMDLRVTAPNRPDAPEVHALVSVIGVRRSDDKSKMPASVEIRLRIENEGREPVTFDTPTMKMFAANLREFEKPIVEPDTAFDIPPGGSRTITAYFPFPGGTYAGMDLGGLNLKWFMTIANEHVPGRATFVRERYRYENSTRHHFGFGVGYPHHFHSGYCW